MKTKEELKVLKTELESLNKKLAELTDDELKQVTGGFIPPIPCANNPFIGNFNGNGKTVNLNAGPGPEGYDCSGLVS